MRQNLSLIVIISSLKAGRGEDAGKPFIRREKMRLIVSEDIKDHH